MFFRITVLSACLFFMYAMQHAQVNVPDENSLFQGNEMVESNKIISNALLSNQNRKSVELTGNIQSISAYGMSSKFLKGNTNTDVNQWIPAMQGNLLLDIRLTQGVKAFANVQASYTPSNPQYAQYLTGSSGSAPASPGSANTNTSTTTLNIQELFMDANINNQVYFRAGKQVLQWGVGNFWSPSDLINVQKQSFYAISGYSQYIEGSYGLKTHIPFGTSANLYGFINMNGATRPEDMAFAAKAEFLVNPVEFAFAIWAKDKFHPIYAFDLTTRLFNAVDFRGEASFADYDMTPRISNAVSTVNYIVYGQTINITGTNAVPYSVSNQFVTKASVGFTRTFDWDIPDRISLTLELYYKSDGYTENLFKNDYDRQFLSFTPGYYNTSDFYAYNWALITSFNEFIDQNVTLSLNMIGNFIDYSFILGPTVSWSPVYDFTISLSAFGYIGDVNTEYTFLGNGLTVFLTGSILF